jgi:hypothetical protein
MGRAARVSLRMATLVVAVYFFLVPALLAIHDLRDPALQTGEVPHSAWRLFRALTPKYERWARDRGASGRARQLGTEDIAGTEWPVFGSVFYLWAVEGMQSAWENNHSLAITSPRLLAREAIDASVALVLDDGHATWVKEHWGKSYLTHGNAFYRAPTVNS